MIPRIKYGKDLIPGDLIKYFGPKLAKDQSVPTLKNTKNHG